MRKNSKRQTKPTKSSKTSKNGNATTNLVTLASAAHLAEAEVFLAIHSKDLADLVGKMYTSTLAMADWATFLGSFLVAMRAAVKVHDVVTTSKRA